jgi:dynein heavy chain
MFLFSLVWSIGASCDNNSRAKFDAFLRALLAGKVTASAERADYDLGPGIEVKYPAQLLQVAVPEVGDPANLRCNEASCWA